MTLDLLQKLDDLVIDPQTDSANLFTRIIIGLIFLVMLVIGLLFRAERRK